MSTCSHCKRDFPDCAPGTANSKRLWAVIDARYSEGKVSYYCDPFCGIRHQLNQGTTLAPPRFGTSWKNIESFFRTLPDIYPEEEDEKHFQQYKYLMDLDQRLTLDQVRKGIYDCPDDDDETSVHLSNNKN